MRRAAAREFWQREPSSDREKPRQEQGGVLLVKKSKYTNIAIYNFLMRVAVARRGSTMPNPKSQITDTSSFFYSS